MKVFCFFSVLAISLTSLSVFAGPAVLNHTYEVTITNLTQGQIWGKPILYTHTADVGIFALGAPASEDLRILAEEGNQEPMATHLKANRNVMEVVTGAGPILPGASHTYLINSNAAFPMLSVAGMLGTTNDTFSAIQGMELTQYETTFLGSAYDAGTEENNEDCNFIPGPPCNHPGARAPAEAEGKVQKSPGLSGGGDLDFDHFSWSAAVIKVAFKRLN